VVTTVENRGASRLMTGTTWSPSGTARLPPGQKSFCTSTTISASSRFGAKAIGSSLGAIDELAALLAACTTT
jgi:hypothetical protein